MANRCLLHINKLEAFRAYLDWIGKRHRPGKGEWEALQVEYANGWRAIFLRARMDEHYTVPEALVPLVRAFIRYDKAANAAKEAS